MTLYCYKSFHAYWNVSSFFLLQVIAARQRMSDEELRRRDVTGMISYQTILSKIKLLQINREDYIQPSGTLDINGLVQEYNVEVSSPFFIVPSRVVIPQNDSNWSSGHDYFLFN